MSQTYILTSQILSRCVLYRVICYTLLTVAIGFSLSLDDFQSGFGYLKILGFYFLSQNKIKFSFSWPVLLQQIYLKSCFCDFLFTNSTENTASSCVSTVSLYLVLTGNYIFLPSYYYYVCQRLLEMRSQFCRTFFNPCEHMTQQFNLTVHPQCNCSA